MVLIPNVYPFLKKHTIIIKKLKNDLRKYTLVFGVLFINNNEKFE